MKSNQKNVVKMIRTVSNYLNKNNSTIELSVPMMNTKALFDQKFANLVDHFVVQYQDNSGYALDKKNKRKTVEEKANALSAALCALASLNENSDLLTECHFTATTLKTVSGDKLVQIGTNLTLRLEEYAASLQPYGIEIITISDFKKSISDFSDSINKPKEIIKIRNISTIAIAKILGEITSLLKTNLDYNVRVFKDDSPSFVKGYFDARRIGKIPRKTLDLIVNTISKDSKEPIQKAKVQIINTKISRFSGKKGRNVFMNLKSGLHQLRVTHPNYEPQTVDFTIIENQTITLVVALDYNTNLPQKG
jgi:hypothetical protein